jgi:hypothetical protein
MNAALFPLALILSILSDFAAGKPDMGIFLAIRARKPSEMVNVTAK